MEQMKHIKEQVETFEAAGYVWYRHEPGQPMPMPSHVNAIALFRDHDCIEASHVYSWDKYSDKSREVIGYRFPDYPATMPPEPNKTLQQQQPDAELLELRSFKEKLLQLYHGWFDCVPDSANECMSDLSRLLYPTDEDRCEAEFCNWVRDDVENGKSTKVAYAAWKAAWKAARQ